MVCIVPGFNFIELWHVIEVISATFSFTFGLLLLRLLMMEKSSQVSLYILLINDQGMAILHPYILRQCRST